VNMVVHRWCPQKVVNFIISWVTISFSRRTLFHIVSFVQK
jgi:hypothetical protein